MLRREDWHLTYRWARRIAISVVGGTVLAIGVAMIVLPGPALIVIPLGLAILGVEYAWARRWLRKVRVRTAYYMSRVKGNGRKPAEVARTAGQPGPRPPARRRQEPPPPGVT